MVAGNLHTQLEPLPGRRPATSGSPLSRTCPAYPVDEITSPPLKLAVFDANTTT